MGFYGFSPQGMQQNQGMYSGMQQNNILPPQQVLQANGKASIDALRMAPNSSVLIMDSKEPIVWLCTTDGIGNVTSAPYDISPHKDPDPVDVNGLESRVASIENILTRLEEKLNGKPDDEPIKAANRNDGKPWSGKGNGQSAPVNGQPSSHAQ